MNINSRLWFVIPAILAIAFALSRLHAAAVGVTVEVTHFGATPARIYRSAVAPATSPVVVIAHGFAGSQRLMQTYALALARNGYTAVTFDFLGHGRHPQPLTGSITDPRGATQSLLIQLREVVAGARTLGDGRMAVLGHSMASDVIVRLAQSTPGIAATIAVSMFSPAVTAAGPPNLLVLVGDWESMLKREALRAVGLATAPNDAQPLTTYGDFAAGTARRVAFVPHTEHVSVLYGTAGLAEAIAWLDGTFDTPRTLPPVLATQGPWILLLLGGAVLFGWSAAPLLPRVSTPATGGGRPWPRLALPLFVPAVATPLLLRVLPTHFLPVLVGDYVAAHFLAYGLLTGVCLLMTRTGPAQSAAKRTRWLAFSVATLAVIAFSVIGLNLPLDAYFTSFVPGPGRRLLVLALLGGTLVYFLSDEWLTRGPDAGRGAYPVAKFAFLGSLGIAVALDFERLFFLIIIVPLIALYFLVYGALSRWTYAATGHPLVAGVANALAFAWAVGVVFPLVAA